jgi:hypothetical protein
MVTSGGKGGARIFIEGGLTNFAIVGQNKNIREAVEDGPLQHGSKKAYLLIGWKYNICLSSPILARACLEFN